MRRILMVVFMLLLQTGCNTNGSTPLPEQAVPYAEIPGFKNIRTDFTDGDNPLIKKQSLARVRQLARTYPDTMFHHKGSFTLLVISGGADYGAFGAGLLNGWTRSGGRPTFTTVTGISTGALIAPLAFAGPKYDATLKKVYTTITTKDVLSSKPLLWTLITGSDSLKGTKPLQKLIARHVDEPLLDDIAKGYYQGRRLYVGTSNLYSRKLIVWDMTRIAASKNPGRVDLFRKILLASASIPVVMPPVEFEVVARGKPYTEMHVDGGVTFGLFLSRLASDIKTAKKHLKLKQKPDVKIYVIRNNQNQFHYKIIKPKLLTIGKRAIESVTASQGAADVIFIYLCALLTGADFNLANVPNEFDSNSEELFDLKRMNQLYKIGYTKALKGYPWQKVPPDVVELHGN
ncbi:patatin-like phospholipase family protein [Legionella spiritensis]|nr:patatin-like phospholipase family protein [Legionella spiritensis]